VILSLAALFVLRHLAGPAFFHYLFYRRWAGRYSSLNNQAALPKAAQIASERAYTGCSSLCDLAILGLCVLLVKGGATQVYFDFSARGWIYGIASFFLLMILQDAYFYFTHRFMHWKPVFRFAHYVHHKSKNPTPWSAFSVHPAEKTLELFFFPLALLLLPLHPAVVIVFVLFSSLINLWGHTGYELNIFKVDPHGLTRLNSTPTFHNMHHELFNYNYSLYFSFWDKLLGTEHKDYAERLVKVSARSRAEN
jgi:lathosterol oxidase